MGTLLAVLAAAGTAASASAASAPQIHLTMFIFPGDGQNVVPQAVVNAYEKAHPNVHITLVESSTTIWIPKMIAAKKVTPKNNPIDFGIWNSSAIAQGELNHLWGKLDLSEIPNAANIVPGYVAKDDTWLGFESTFLGLAYSKKYTGPRPNSWTDLWNPTFKGKVDWEEDSFEPLVIAARLNGGSETDIDPGFKVWEANASNFNQFVSSNTPIENDLTTGAAWIAPWYAANVHSWIESGAPIGLSVPKEGAVAEPIKLGMVTNLTPAEKTVVFAIFNKLLSPANDGKYGRLTYAIPLVKNAVLDKQQRTDPDLRLSIAKNAIQLNWNVMARNQAAWEQRWDQDVVSRIGG
jgi:putative spermidine/putrescine transport system substrate-binding protein